MERHYLTMRYIIKAVDKPVGASEHFISAVVHCKYSIIKRISSYYISCLPALLTISCNSNITRMTNTKAPASSSSQVRLRNVYEASNDLK